MRGNLFSIFNYVSAYLASADLAFYDLKFL